MKKVIVTGAAGFIGSNFVEYLNSRGISDIYVADYLTNGIQFKNLKKLSYTKFLTPDEVNRVIQTEPIDAVYHFGAISDTTNWNGEEVMIKNYQYTMNLIQVCREKNVLLSYSSSASVYGNGDGPLNLYAYSKWLIDQEVYKILKEDSSTRLQGFRYFNVYGPNEWHKGKQASPYYQFTNQALESGIIKIFEGSENYKRDFVHVDTVCDLQYKMSLTSVSGIFDLGTGKSRSFKEIAELIAEDYDAKIVEIPFPEKLKDHYQFNTCANMLYIKNLINI